MLPARHDDDDDIVFNLNIDNAFLSYFLYTFIVKSSLLTLYNLNSACNGSNPTILQTENYVAIDFQ